MTPNEHDPRNHEPRSGDEELVDRELLARDIDHDAERPVDLDDALDEALPPPTIDPDERELRDPAEPIAAVAEVAVIPGGHAEHPDEIRPGEPPDERPGERHEEDSERGEVQQHERNDRAEAVTSAPATGTGVTRRRRRSPARSIN